MDIGIERIGVVGSLRQAQDKEKTRNVEFD